MAAEFRRGLANERRRGAGRRAVAAPGPRALHGGRCRPRRGGRGGAGNVRGRVRLQTVPEPRRAGPGPPVSHRTERGWAVGGEARPVPVSRCPGPCWRSRPALIPVCDPSSGQDRDAPSSGTRTAPQTFLQLLNPARGLAAKPRPLLATAHSAGWI